MNDLTALGYAALRLTPSQLVPVAERSVDNSIPRQALVVGIGTGFNVSPVFEKDGHTICPAVEAGHTSLYASITAELDRLMPRLAQGVTTVEALFSGRGRRKFLSLFTGENVKSATPYIANPEIPTSLAGVADLLSVLENFKFALNVAFFVRHDNFLHPELGKLQEVFRESVHIYSLTSVSHRARR